MLIAGARNERGKRIEIYLIERTDGERATRVVEKLLERGWDAQMRATPVSAIETTAPPKAFAMAWEASDR